MDQPSSENLTSAPVPFRRTLQSLEIDKARDSRARQPPSWSSRRWRGPTWSVTARIPIYATSDLARLESQMSTYRIAPAVDGHISRADLQLGQIVHKGQVLVELDSTTPRNALEEGTTRLAALRQDVAALNRQIEAEMRAFEADRARQAVAIQRGRRGRGRSHGVSRGGAATVGRSRETARGRDLSPTPPRPPLRRRRKRNWRV